MRNYFNFNLTGKKLLPIWLLFLILFIIPYIIVITTFVHPQQGEKQSWLMIPIIILLLIIAFILIFFIIKMVIENVSFKDKLIVFNGNFGKFLGKFLLGLFLSIITLGIYSAWFIRNMQRFFVDNSSLDSHSFVFKGKAGKLLVIFLLLLILPIIILSILMTKFIMNNGHNTLSTIIIQQIVTQLIMIPYTYLFYKWMVNIDYKDLNISWETNFWNSCGKLAFEILLTIITFGLYLPLAIIRLYKYFTGKTIAVSGDKKYRFGFDIEWKTDFLFIWGQILLTIITLGIYFPWAFCGIHKRILRKTYIEENYQV